MAAIRVTCKNCGNIFGWDDQWPGGLKRCPLCGILVGVSRQSSEADNASEVEKPSGND
jgi:hypothetical protein